MPLDPFAITNAAAPGVPMKGCTAKPVEEEERAEEHVEGAYKEHQAVARHG